MQESHDVRQASRVGPESCVVTREGGREALTGGYAGQVSSRETSVFREADPIPFGARPHVRRRFGKAAGAPARSKTLCMRQQTSTREPGEPVLGSGRWSRVRAENPRGARQR